MRYSTITQIGTFVSINETGVDYLLLDPARCTGGADAPLRTTLEAAPGRGGALVFPPLDDAQQITLAGTFIINSADYFAGIDTLLATLKTALDALKTAPGPLVHSGGTLQVWKNAPIEESWQGALMSVTFGLVVDVFA